MNKLYFFIPIFLFMLIFCTKANVIIQYRYRAKKQDLLIKIRILFISITISPLKYRKLKEKNDFNYSLDTINDFFTSFKKIYRPLILFAREFIQKVKIKSFKMELVYGFEDAALTAYLFGVIYAVLGILFSVIVKYHKYLMKNIRVEPVYNEKLLKINFDCIIRFKIGDIIVMTVKLVYHILRGGVYKRTRSSYRRSYADSNE